jgi:eukaryotic-like serine/threonine-protein kinase
MQRIWPLCVLVFCACDAAAPTCPEGMALIPAGPAVLGLAHPVHPWHRPQAKVQLGAYCMDRYEYPNQAGVKPRANVGWDEAARLCAAAGRRLCTEDEWERACRGPNGQTYVYGDTRDARRCNTPIEGSGPGPNPPPLAASGAHEGCVSAEGVYDLNGNLSEWVSDPWTGQPEPFNRKAVPDAEGWRAMRGGTMWNQTFYGQDCLSRHGHARAFQNMDDGFRCCAEAR